MKLLLELFFILLKYLFGFLIILVLLVEIIDPCFLNFLPMSILLLLFTYIFHQSHMWIKTKKEPNSERN